MKPTTFPFVNREKGSLLLLESLCNQHSEKGLIPILNQYSGIGKTSLVRNFQEVVKSQNPFSDVRNRTQEKLMGAVLIEVNFITAHYLQQGIASSMSKGGSLMKNIIDLMYYSMVEEGKHDEQAILKLCMQELGIIYEEDLDKGNEMFNRVAESLCQSSNFCDFLKNWSKNQLSPLLFFFDEISTLSQDEMLTFFQNYIFPFIMKPDNESPLPFFFIVAGKSTNLSRIRLPSQSIHIVLPIFSVEDIVKLISETVVPINMETNLTMKDFLCYYCGLDANFEYFCSVLRIYSGGIPRSVIETIESFLYFMRNNQARLEVVNLRERKEIDDLFKDMGSKALVYDANLIFY